MAGLGSAGALYVRSELLNTDRYVATVEPLAENTAIRDALADFVVTTIYQHVDAPRLAREALPTNAEYLAGPLADTLPAFSRQVVERFLASSGFRTLWAEANRLAHTQLVALLENQTRRAGPVTLHDGVVTVDLSRTIATAQQRLAAAGLSFVRQVHVPDATARYRLVSSALLGQVRGYVAVLHTLTWAFPVLMLLAFAASIWLLPDRRRAVRRVGIAFAVPMAVLLLALAVARTLYVEAATGAHVSRGAAGAVFDIILRALHDGAVAGALLGAAVAAGAWLGGPSPAAVRVRRTVQAAAAGVRDGTEAIGWRPGPVTAAAAAHRPALRIGAAAATFLVFLAWPRPTVAVVVMLAGGLLLGLLVLEVIGRAGTGVAPRPPSGRPS